MFKKEKKFFSSLFGNMKLVLFEQLVKRALNAQKKRKDEKKITIQINLSRCTQRRWRVIFFHRIIRLSPAYFLLISMRSRA